MILESQVINPEARRWRINIAGQMSSRDWKGLPCLYGEDHSKGF